MKKMMIFVLMSIIFGLGTLSAQTENAFEGESVSRVSQVNKMKSKLLTKNILAKMIAKGIMKRYIDNNPNNYIGAYDSKLIYKGNKTRAEMSYNNSIMITTIDGDKISTVTYFPYIKKGYTGGATSISQSKQQLEEMRKGEVEKTGETMTILGRKCYVYKVRYQHTTDSAGTKTVMNLHNDFAICQDPDLPGVDTEVLPGVKGVPLKCTVNTLSQTTNEMVNLDVDVSISTILKSITPRKVDDSEFEIPSDIKMIDANKEPKKFIKMLEENKKYMMKKGLWKETPEDEAKIYDNLSEEWDF